MKREVYAMTVINPIRFPDDLEIRLYPLSRKDNKRLGESCLVQEPHRSWDWVCNNYALARPEVFQEVRGYLESGKLANLVHGDTVIDLPEGMVWPEDKD